MGRKNPAFPNLGNAAEFPSAELAACLSDVTERAGFEPAVLQRAHRFSKPAP